jgi:predicted RNA-binding Zn ribbon-like protein
VTDAALVVALANAQARRRPPRARSAVEHDALADAARANELLGPFLDAPIHEHELPALRTLQRAVVAVVNALIAGSDPPVEALTTPAVCALERAPDGALCAMVRPKRPSTPATLAIAAIRELSELDPSRLRRCARLECSLVFYDVTRSGTQRWHAESPCGLRARQRRHRARHAGQT